MYLEEKSTFYVVFFYATLLKLYGGVPLLKTTLSFF